MEDYKKKYEKTEERAKNIYNSDPYNSIVRAVCEQIFPELKESEDERIKRCIGMCLTDANEQRFEDFNTTLKDCLSWLEKQGEKNLSTDFSDLRTWKYIVDAVLTEKEGIGQYLDSPFTEETAKKLQKRFGNIEQKPADKVEPKFREGDIIIHKELGGDYIHNSHKIIQVDILDKKYRLEGGLVAHFSEQDDYELVEQRPAWSEEDEEMIDLLIAIFRVNYPNEFYKTNPANTPNMGGKHSLEIINWLKSLKERMKGE